MIFVLVLLCFFAASISALTLNATQLDGCRPSIPASVDYKGLSLSCTLVSGNSTRVYRIYVPSKYDSGTPTPLVISFHAAGKDGRYQEVLSQFSNEVINPSMIAVYPQGAANESGAKVWDGPTYASAVGPRINISDTIFTMDLIADMKRRYNIDTQGVFAAGKGIGGGFLHTLACSPEYGKGFTAFAPVAGAFYTDNGIQSCDPARTRVPMIEFHGLADEIAPYSGSQTSEGGPLPPIEAWLSRWAARNGCNDTSLFKISTLVPGKVRNVTSTSYCPANGNVVQHYRIGGLRNNWPSTAPNADNNISSEASLIDASPIIMNFFNEQFLLAKGAFGPDAS